MSSITIQRSNQMIGRYGSMAAMVDGKKVGILLNDQSLTVSVEPGQHEVYMRQTWLVRSNKINVEVEEGETVIVDVGTAMKVWWIFVTPVYFWKSITHQLLYTRVREG